MPTPYNKQADHYVNAKGRADISRLLRAEDISHADLAYEMRMTRTHISGMLGGSKKMAHHHLLAMQMVLLKRRSENQQRERNDLTVRSTT